MAPPAPTQGFPLGPGNTMPERKGPWFGPGSSCPTSRDARRAIAPAAQASPGSHVYLLLMAPSAARSTLSTCVPLRSSIRKDPRLGSWGDSLPRKAFTAELRPIRRDPRFPYLRIQDASYPTARRTRHPLWAKPQPSEPGPCGLTSWTWVPIPKPLP